MKKLNNSFTRIFIISILTVTAFFAQADDISSHIQVQSQPVSTGFTIPESISGLIALGDRFVQLGQAELALEHYSRSIREGRMIDPDYTDEATEIKIVALVKQIGEEKTRKEVANLIAQGDSLATDQPEQALEFYSRSIRIGKIRDTDYMDSSTQKKIVNLVTILGEKVAQAE
ncbi:MAG: hypothetical protein ACFB15_26655 [Cyclobacteriaceae bacterium]